ncbi:ATP-binding cassette domain-containing protein, partial [Thermodesulfobacteriota bacterium]
MGNTFFELENLSKKFGELSAVDNVSFEIGRDEMVALIGPNGAGKSTIIRLITSILKSSNGKIKFKGENITNNSTSDIINKGIAATFQIVKPFRHLPVIANVMVSCLCPRAKTTGDWVKGVEVRARDALEFCGI